MTVEEYLAADEVSDRPLEYLDGVVFPADEGPPSHASESGPAASSVHAALLATLIVSLGSRLSGSSCRLFANLSLQIGLTPCALAIASAQDINVTAPKVIFEILSPSTHDYDYGAKCKLYRQLVSLEEYVLLSRDEPQVEVFRRAPGQWTLFTFDGPEQSLILESLNLQIPLSELYTQLP